MKGGLASFHGGHSKFGDGEGEVRDIADAAARKAFQAFGFSEHFQFPPARLFLPPGPDDPLLGRGDWIGGYVQSVSEVKQELSDRIPILLGCELEYIEGAAQWTKDAVSAWPFDYFVGSVHFVRYGGEDICIDCDQKRFAEALLRAGSAERVQLDYFDHVMGLVAWGVANVIGHMDLIKIMLPPEDRVPTSAIRQRVQGLLEAMRDEGVAIDVNARGLEKPCREIYPAQWILEEARKIGVHATLGDDSHGPSEVGLRLEFAVEALRRAGYEEMALVRPGGGLEPVPLP